MGRGKQEATRCQKIQGDEETVKDDERERGRERERWRLPDECIIWSSGVLWVLLLRVNSWLSSEC